MWPIEMNNTGCVLGNMSWHMNQPSLKGVIYEIQPEFKGRSENRRQQISRVTNTYCFVSLLAIFGFSQGQKLEFRGCTTKTVIHHITMACYLSIADYLKSQRCIGKFRAGPQTPAREPSRSSSLCCQAISSFLIKDFIVKYLQKHVLKNSISLSFPSFHWTITYKVTKNT